ncbi:MAG: DNA metabolism protein [Lachnospiraceae bacterium]|jgi:probable DNA metabolism protein|nr:DNA metabolism protein [Lachnospiraceae bacterium]
MKPQRIYVCDNSIDGIFTAIYQAWSSRYGHANIKIEEKYDHGACSNFELFSEYISVDTDYAVAVKVAESIQTKISEEAYQMVYHVALSNYQGKADLVYRFLILGFAIGPKVVQHLSNEVVGQMFALNKKVGNEVHHLLGFLRFTEQENRILTSVIHPQNNVLSLVVPHFADRLPEERFIIVDGNRNMAALHAPGKQWILMESQEITESIGQEISGKEAGYQELWKAFFNSIAIMERTNYKLQRNNLPLRFRKDMTEFTSANARSSHLIDGK